MFGDPFQPLLHRLAPGLGHSRDYQARIGIPPPKFAHERRHRQELDKKNAEDLRRQYEAELEASKKAIEQQQTHTGELNSQQEKAQKQVRESVWR
jgi:TATA-binding protein-associated factor Taf7